MSKTVGKSTYIYTTNECSAPQWSIFNISTKTVIWKRKLKYEIWHILHFHLVLHCSGQSCSTYSKTQNTLEILFVSPRILEKDCYSLVWNSVFITIYLHIVTKIKKLYEYLSIATSSWHFSHLLRNTPRTASRWMFTLFYDFIITYSHE